MRETEYSRYQRRTKTAGSKDFELRTIEEVIDLLIEKNEELHRRLSDTD